MLFVSQEERRASDTVLFTSENNDIGNQSINTSFFTCEKNGMTNQLASKLAQRDYFYLDAFWRVNLCMYIIILFIHCKVCSILGDPGAVSRVGRKGGTKVFKYGRKSPWVPLSPSYFQKFKRMPAPDWAKKKCSVL